MKFPVAFINFIDRANQWLYRVTGGRVGGQLWRFPMLLLHTIGRKSGQVRTHTLLYVRDGENLVVCASNNGQPQYPGWYWNLKANPEARVQTGRHAYEVNAEMVSGAEYERLWQKFLKVYPPYSGYRARATRELPIVVLRPVCQERDSV